MLQRKQEFLSRMDGLTGTLLCGVSGGADSMALLSLLISRRDRGGIDLHAVHVNHGLRGDESDADEAFVRSYCNAQHVPLYTYRLTPPEHPGEGWARDARYAAFAEAMKLSHADALVLAHHRDDQAETVIGHLLRGSGLDGLCAMRSESYRSSLRILRPLLDAAGSDLRAYLVQQGIPWREDSTNAGNDYFRNRIRHEVMPLLESLSPGAAERIARTASVLAEDADTLTVLAEDWLSCHPGACLRIDALVSQPSAIRSRILRRWYRRIAGEAFLGREHTEAMMNLLTAPTGSAVMLPGEYKCFRGACFLHLQDGKPYSIPRYSLAEAGTYAMGDVTVSITESRGHHGNGRTQQELPRELLRDAELRTRRPGDIIRPFGMAGKQSLQDYFVNRRIDEPFRDRVPLVCRGSEVLFVCGVGAGAIPRWSPENENVRIVVSGTIPWDIANEGSIF